MRIRIPSAKADLEFLEQARAALASLPGVTDVSVNPMTGSLLILHSPQGQRELDHALASPAEKPMPFVLQTVSVPHSSVHRRRRKPAGRSDLSHAIIETVTDLDDALRIATGGAMDLKLLVPIVLAGLGVTFLGRSRTTPIWLTLLMFAFSSFVAFHGAGGVVAEE
ncbi:MAG TPA: hypothetical protein VEF07_08830, partial [Candidatus Binataceae bacterium]|nr:hypothetical protein [Candidatus Binataceae bacterium]